MTDWPAYFIRQAAEQDCKIQAALSQSAPPSEGEVGVLIRELQDAAFDLNGSDPERAMLTRAAALLSRQAPQPVAVSERLPGPQDCDAEGRCWLCGKVEGDWRLMNPEKSGVPQLKYCFSHWLPAHALPVPVPGEVQS